MLREYMTVLPVLREYIEVLPMLREYIAVAGTCKKEILCLMLDRKEMERERDLLLPVRLHPSQFLEPPNIALHFGNQVLQVRVHREIFHVLPTMPGKVLNTASSVLRIIFCSEHITLSQPDTFLGFPDEFTLVAFERDLFLGCARCYFSSPKAPSASLMDRYRNQCFRIYQTTLLYEFFFLTSLSGIGPHHSLQDVPDF